MSLTIGALTQLQCTYNLRVTAIGRSVHKSSLYKLTVDEKIHRLADHTTDTIRHDAPERSLVTAGHTHHGESGASVSELNSVTLCDLRAAVQPEERGGGARGGAGQTHRAELQQVCGV